MPLLSPRSVADAHWRRLERIRANTAALIEAQWRRTGFDSPDVERTVQTVLTAQRAIVATVEADMAAIAGLATATQPFTVGIDAERLIGKVARNGVSLEQVYVRPITVARASGFDRGVDYLRQAVYLDSQLAQRQAATAVVEADTRIVGWRRQVNPSGGKTCGLCVAAAARTYSKQDLLPLHPMCRCSVIPVMGDDPIRDGNYIDRERLDAVYAQAAGQTDRSTLGAIRFSADELPPGVDSEAVAALGPRVAWHPEIGEYLTGNRHDTSITL